MSKTLFAVLVAAGLITAPLPALIHNAAAQTTAPEKKQTKAKKPPTPGQLAARERMKKCAAEWKEAKAAGKIEKILPRVARVRSTAEIVSEFGAST